MMHLLVQYFRILKNLNLKNNIIYLKIDTKSKNSFTFALILSELIFHSCVYRNGRVRFKKKICSFIVREPPISCFFKSFIYNLFRSFSYISFISIYFVCSQKIYVFKSLSEKIVCSVKNYRFKKFVPKNT